MPHYDANNGVIKKCRNKFYNFLRWTEKWTKTDMVYLTKSSFWLLAFEVISLLGLFLTTVFFANFLPKEEYGIYKYLISLAGILTAFSLSGMNTAVTKSVANGYQGSLKQSFLAQIKWNIIITFISLAAALYYLLYKNDPAIFWGLIIIGIASPILNSANTFLAYLNGIKDFKRMFQLNTSINLASSLFTIIGMVVFPNAIFLVLIYFLINTIANFLCYVLVIKKYKPNNLVEPTTINYGRHLSVINFLGIIALNFDKVISFNFLGPAQLAVYNFAIALPEQLRGVIKIVPAISLPKMATSESIGINKIFFKKIAKLTLASLILITIYILLAPFIYRLFFPQYLDSVLLSQIFVISLIFTIPSMPLVSYLQAKEKTKLLYKYNISSAVIQIAGIIILGYFWGLMGIIVSRIISSIVNLVYISYLIKK